MPILINPQYAAAGFANYGGFGQQYGVGLPSMGSALSGLAGSALPTSLLGAGFGAIGNIISTAMQNQQQERFYNEYMSPSARMREMMKAGINPNLAAQGIAGSSAPQMNAASPSQAFTGIGEQIGGSVNSALDAYSIEAGTRNQEAQTENVKEATKGQRLDNAIKEIELGKKPDMLEAELDDIRESANQRRQQIAESKENVKKLQQEVNTLKAEENYIIAQEGLIAYEKRLKAAEAALANAKKDTERLTQEVGVAPGSPYYNYYKAVAEYGEDSEQAQAEFRKLYKTENAVSRGTYDADPEHRNFNSVADSLKSLSSMETECVERQKELYRMYDDGEIDKATYLDEEARNTSTLNEIRSLKKQTEKAFSKESYKNGYHTQWQNSVDSIVRGLSTGIGIGVGAGLTRGVGAVGTKARPIGFR